MIPVFQTRHALETFGNCVEACIASILEVPLSAIPDRTAHVDLDAWANRVRQAEVAGVDLLDLELPDGYEQGEAELEAWLADRGLWLTDRELDQDVGPGYWIGHFRQRGGTLHAVVCLGPEPVHNPARRSSVDREVLGRLEVAQILVLSEPARLVSRLGSEMLPMIDAAMAAA